VRGKGRIEIPEIRKREKIYLLLVSIFLVVILFYTFILASFSGA